MDSRNKNNISTKNNSISISESKNDLKENNENNNNELPIINTKIINKKPKGKLFYKKIVFNPISYDYQSKIKLLSQVKPIAKTINKHYSMKEISEFAHRKYLMKNYQKNTDINNNNNSNSKRNNKKKRIISRNISDINVINERPNLNIINITKNHSTKEKENNIKKITKSENKSKIYCNTNRYIINYRNSLEAIYDPKNHEDKKYQNKLDFVHNYLYKTSDNEIIKPINKKNIKEILPRYEFISYSGKTSKVITKLTSTKYEPKEEKKLSIIKLKLKSPYLVDYENVDDYRNKRYIKILQYKKKKSREKEMKLKKKELKNFNEINKRGLEEVHKMKNKSFSELVNNAFEQRDKITFKLENLINIDKKMYEKEFEAIKSNK